MAFAVDEGERTQLALNFTAIVSTPRGGALPLSIAIDFMSAKASTVP